jgi:hypothetical protein
MSRDLRNVPLTVLNCPDAALREEGIRVFTDPNASSKAMQRIAKACVHASKTVTTTDETEKNEELVRRWKEWFTDRF